MTVFNLFKKISIAEGKIENLSGKLSAVSGQQVTIACKAQPVDDLSVIVNLTLICKMKGFFDQTL